MKIVQLTSGHCQYDTRIFHKICKSLASLGHEVVHIGPAKKTYDIKQGYVEGLNEGVMFKPVKVFKNYHERLFLGQARLYKAAKAENADVYHFHDFDLILVGILLKWHGKKVVYDVHEDYSLDWSIKMTKIPFLRVFLSKIINFIEKFFASKFDAVITVTPKITEKFSKLNPIIIRNLPLLEKMESVQSSIAYKDRQRDVCYVGGIGEKRGLYSMLEAITRLKNVRLSLAGAPNPLDKEAIQNTDRVDFYGFVPYDEGLKITSNSKCALLPLFPNEAYCYALPNKLFEYMACGTPVVASNFPLFKEIVEGNGCGICVDPQNPKAIAAAIESILKNPDEAAKMGENGRKAVLEHYNWTTEELKLKALYEGLAG